LGQTQAEIQEWLLTPSPHTPKIFSSFLDDLQNDLCEEWRDLFLPVSPVAPPLRDRSNVSQSFMVGDPSSRSFQYICPPAPCWNALSLDLFIAVIWYGL